MIHRLAIAHPARSISVLIRSGLWLASTAAAAAAATVPSPPAETYTYKSIGALEIKADVYRPSSPPAGPAPVVVFIHGGSLIDGGRQAVSKTPMKDLFLAGGAVVVSVDYRLAPESKLVDIVADLEDAFRWVRASGPKLFGADPERVAAVGTSAGGFLAEIAGFRIQPSLRVVGALSGYCDILGTWQTLPSRNPDHTQYHLTREEAWQKVSGPKPTNGRDRPKENGDAFNGYVRQHAEWPQAVTGWDPAKENDRYTPYLPIRNVTSKYPPAVLLHGSDDPDVPCEQAEMMAAELNRHGVVNLLLVVPGGGHGLKGAEPHLADKAIRDAAAFVLQHLVAASDSFPPTPK